MRLPNAHLAVVEEAKITEYLLNAAHPDNGGKAAFFLAGGFSRGEWRILAAALRRVAQTGGVTSSVVSPHGRKYVVDGQLQTPSGRLPVVRTIWIVDQGFDTPRLVTTYAGEEGKQPR
jgi:hypothetical protein